MSVDSLRIEKDKFLLTKEYANYEQYRIQNLKLTKLLEEKKEIKENVLTSYIQNNPDFWKVYALVGDYYFQQKDYQQAVIYYKLALTKEITTTPDRNKTEKKLSKCIRKIAHRKQ